MRAVLIEAFGGPEVLRTVDVPDPQPTDGQLVIDVTLAGVNYADTHRAENSYLAPTSLPFVPGAEVLGRTPDGRRVVALVGVGGYAQRAVASESVVFDVPDGVSDGQALALVLQGATAWHILRTSAHLVPGESVIVHAAAGGVGSLAVQLAKIWGAGRVIGAASSDDKRRLVLELGADEVIDSRSGDLHAAMEQANGGLPVDVVLEMVGGPTFDASLATLAPFGRLVTYGSAGRQAPQPVSAGALIRRSRGVIGFWLAHCYADPGRMLRPQITELFDLVQQGRLKPVVGDTYPLSEAARAHADMRERRTVGKLLLDPAR
jgi:NADPH2:quinone reductase